MCTPCEWWDTHAQDTRQAWLQDKCRTTTGQLQDTHTGRQGTYKHATWLCRVSVLFNFVSVEKGHLLKTRMSDFYFVTLGMLAHAVLVWCGVRATGLTNRTTDYRTSTGQVQDKYKTSAGSRTIAGQLQDNYVQDNYRTTIGQLQDTVLQSSLPSGHASGHCPAPL